MVIQLEILCYSGVVTLTVAKITFIPAIEKFYQGPVPWCSYTTSQPLHQYLAQQYNEIEPTNKIVQNLDIALEITD